MKVNDRSQNPGCFITMIPPVTFMVLLVSLFA
jgi:hypothetical protein